MDANNGKIWIDLDNSPHVPFFKPIMAELSKRNYSMVVTARDCFQVCGLADLLKIDYKPIGKHYGKHKIFKILGSLLRIVQMAPTIMREKPTLAVSHGSRTQQMLASLLGIPSIIIFDYEHAKALGVFHPTYVVVPEVISDGNIDFRGSQIRKYPGIKEDVYVPDFKPDSGIKEVLKINEEDIVVTIRPPASEAHYRNPDSDKLFIATVESLSMKPNVRMIMLPRNEKQAEYIKSKWPGLIVSKKIMIPLDVVDGLNLIWHSDLVISGGGTMNREAAALGVPVYSIFRGKTGAVDRYLEKEGRLTLLTSVDDVKEKIHAIQRRKDGNSGNGSRKTINYILSVIEEAASTH